MSTDQDTERQLQRKHDILSAVKSIRGHLQEINVAKDIEISALGTLLMNVIRNEYGFSEVPVILRDMADTAQKHDASVLASYPRSFH